MARIALTAGGLLQLLFAATFFVKDVICESPLHHTRNDKAFIKLLSTEIGQMIEQGKTGEAAAAEIARFYKRPNMFVQQCDDMLNPCMLREVEFDFRKDIHHNLAVPMGGPVPYCTTAKDAASATAIGSGGCRPSKSRPMALLFQKETPSYFADHLGDGLATECECVPTPGI